MPNKKYSNRGVSLVEVMVALVILLIVFMGLLQASILSIDHNTRNEVRDEAVRFASERMTQSRSIAFTAITSDIAGACPFVDRTFRNQVIRFTGCRTVTNIDTDNRQVTITVTWSYRGDNLTHTINSVLRNK